MKNPRSQILKKVLMVHVEVSRSEVDTRAVSTKMSGQDRTEGTF